MSSSIMNDIVGSLELRKLRSISPSYFIEIVRLLDENDYWKVLMGTVPKELPSAENMHQPNSEKRYNSAQVELVANASKKDERTAAHIFLFEWSTTGRRRPTLDHLVVLMKAANLYGPANYVATKILQQVAVEKPATGPGKSWSKELDEMEAALVDNDENNTIENNLDNSKPMNTLFAANAPKLMVPSARSRQSSIDNKTGCDKTTERIDEPLNVPAVEVTAATASVELDKSPKGSDVCQVGDIVLQSPPESIASQSGPRPNFSGLMQTDCESNHPVNPSCKSTEFSNSTISIDSSRSLHSQTTQSTRLSSAEDNIPHFSDLLVISAEPQANSQNCAKFGVLSEIDNDDNRPQLSALLGATANSNIRNKTESIENLQFNIEWLAEVASQAKNCPDLDLIIPSSRVYLGQSSNTPDFSSLIGKNPNSQFPAFSALLPNVQSKANIETDSNDDTSSSSDD